MLGKFCLVENFFLTLIKLAKQHLPRKDKSPPQELPTGSELQHSPVDVDTETQEQPIIDQQPHRATVDHIKRQWPLLVIGVCFAAVGVALQGLQAPKPLPLIFHYFCMVLELSFVALVVSIYIRQRYEVASVVMERVSIFLGVTAFMLAIGINFRTPFKEITVAVLLHCLARNHLRQSFYALTYKSSQ